MFIFKTQKNQTVLIDRPDITLKRGIHPKENVVCVAFEYKLQVIEVLRANTPALWIQSMWSRCISENDGAENNSNLNENHFGVSWMNYVSKKVGFHTRFGGVNQAANSEINVIIYFFIRYAQFKQTCFIE